MFSSQSDSNQAVAAEVALPGGAIFLLPLFANSRNSVLGLLPWRLLFGLTQSIGVSSNQCLSVDLYLVEAQPSYRASLLLLVVDMQGFFFTFLGASLKCGDRVFTIGR